MRTTRKGRLAMKGICCLIQMVFGLNFRRGSFIPALSMIFISGNLLAQDPYITSTSGGAPVNPNTQVTFTLNNPPSASWDWEDIPAEQGELVSTSGNTATYRFDCTAFVEAKYVSGANPLIDQVKQRVTGSVCDPPVSPGITSSPTSGNLEISLCPGQDTYVYTFSGGDANDIHFWTTPVNGTVISGGGNADQTITVKWNQTGSSYSLSVINDGSQTVAQVDPQISVPGDPSSAPGGPTTGCDVVQLTNSNSSGSIVWYWQNSTTTNESNWANLGFAASLNVTSSGDYWFRSYNTTNCRWGGIGSSKTVTITQSPAQPTGVNLTTTSNCQAGSELVFNNGATMPNGWHWVKEGDSPFVSYGSVSVWNITQPSEAGVYKIAALNGSCWSTPSDNSVTAVINPAPPTPNATFNVTGDPCSGSLTITRSTNSSGNTWYWETSGGMTNDSDNSFTITTSGTYFLRAVSPAGCPSIARQSTGYIDVYTTPAQPTVTITSNQDCNGTTTLSRNGSVSESDWYWIKDGVQNTNYPVAGFDLVIPTQAPPGNYQIAEYNGNCWSPNSSSSADGSLKFRPQTPNPGGYIVDDQCTGSVTITRTGNGPTSPVVWYWQTSENAQIFSHGSQPDFDNFGGGQLWLQAYDTVQECWSSDSWSLNEAVYHINSTPSINDETRQCGGTVTLSAINPIGDVKWFTTAAGGTSFHTGDDYIVSLTDSQSITYYIEEVDGTCISSRVPVIASSTLPPTPSADDVWQCGSPVTLQATGGVGYRWYDDVGTQVGTGSSFSPGMVSETTTFYVVNFDGCESLQDSATIFVSNFAVNVTTPEICSDETVNLLIDDMGAPTTFSWTVNESTPMGATAGSGQIINQTLTNTTGISQTVTYIISSGSCGSTSKQEVVRVNPEATAPTSVVDGDRFLTGPTVVSVSGGSNENYLWYENSSLVNEGANMNIANLTSNRTFEVKSETLEGCVSAGSITATANVHPLPDVSATGPTSFNTGAAPSLSVMGSYDSYQWKKDEVDIGGATNASLNPTSGGGYRAEVFLTNGQSRTTPLIQLNELVNRPDATNIDPTVSVTAPATVGTGPDMNYVRSYAAREAFVETTDLSTINDPIQVTVSTNYVDGLGRSAQSVVHSGAPDQVSDIVSPVFYDAFGRPEAEYLPYTNNGGGSYQYDAKKQQFDFFDTPLAGIADTRNAAGRTLYENSPLNRPLEEASPGDAWYPGDNFDDAGRKTIKFEYRSNLLILDGAIPILEPNTDFSLEKRLNGGVTDPYPDNELSVRVTIDEHGAQVLEYSDKQGRMILKRVEDTSQNPNSPDRWLETYYVYDDLGNLVFVVQPEGMKFIRANEPINVFKALEDGWEWVDFDKSISSYEDLNYLVKQGVSLRMTTGFNYSASGSESFNAKTGSFEDAFLDTWVFQYRYDDRNRMISKRVPGAGWVHMVYDEWDRLVLTQDANQRASDTWIYTKYDNLNRPIITGETVIAGDQAAVQSLVDVFYTGGGPRFETYDDGNAYHEYTNLSYPAGVGNDVLTVTYYDRYNFSFAEANPYDATAGYHTQNTAVIGSPTGSKTRILGTSNYLSTVTYYDEKYRVIQTIADNNLGAIDINSSKYDFIGNLVENYSIHQKPTENDISIVQQNEYDHGNRLLQSTHAIAGVVSWKNLVNVVESNGVLTKTSGGTSSWDAGASSNEFIPAGEDGFIQYLAAETNKNRVIGLGDSDYAQSMNDIDYGFFLKTNGLQIRENGSLKWSGSFNTGDAFRIERVGTEIRYFQNNQLVRTKTGAIQGNLYVDVTIRHIPGTVQKVYMGQGPKVTIAKNEYNTLGELINKDLHTAAEEDPLQSVDYEYNARGWLTNINNSTLTPQTGDLNADLFGMELYYNHGFGGAAEQYNGNITGVKWKTAVEDTERSYGFLYDPLNRLEYSDYAANTGLGWLDELGRYEVHIDGYDHNGNIMSLDREGQLNISGANAYGALDELSYTYSGNRLVSVEDVVPDLTGRGDFTNGNTSGNDYNYDANGNMIVDRNKGITAISYNHLNLPEKVVFEDDSRRIDYIYDAAGIKLQQRVYDGDPVTPVKVTDYASGMIYENDTLQFIQHGEGRVMANMQADSSYNWEYQYHMKDHLGNVRLTFTSQPDVLTYLATMESENNAEEQLYFQNMDPSHLANEPLADYDPPMGDEVYLTNEVHPVGAGIMLPVIPGDKVDISAYAYYDGGSGFSTGLPVGTLNSAVTSFLTGVNATTELARPVGDIVNDLFNGGFGALGTGDDDVPAAYINYLMFDDDMNFVSAESGFIGISNSANGAPEGLQYLFNAASKGFLLIYLSNESNSSSSSNNVYWDDLKVELQENLIVQADDYYPFGLTFNGFQRGGIKHNNYLYNSFEKQTDLDWNVYDYQARYYDPVIGRFMQVDPAADLMRRHSVYNYAFDNPIRFIDPDGMMPTDSNESNDCEDDPDCEKKEETPTPTQEEIDKVLDEARENGDLITIYKSDATKVNSNLNTEYLEKQIQLKEGDRLLTEIISTLGKLHTLVELGSEVTGKYDVPGQIGTMLNSLNVMDKLSSGDYPSAALELTKWGLSKSIGWEITVAETAYAIYNSEYMQTGAAMTLLKQKNYLLRMSLQYERAGDPQKASEFYQKAMNAENAAIKAAGNALRARKRH